MTHRTSSGLLNLLALISAVMAGCTGTIDVMPSPDTSAAPASHAIAREERVPLILDAVRIAQNGSPQTPPSELDRRLLGALNELQLFSRLSSFDNAQASAQEKAVVARFTIEDTIDSHPGAAAWKGVVIGASMFLLAPVLELHYDYGTALTLELERWDGLVKTYRASSSGTARYNLFAASPGTIMELKGHVLSVGLAHLMEQLAKDTAFYHASSAPSNERTIYSVSVKPKRQTPAVPPLSTGAAAR